ncbi:hypothetical protein F2P81_018751 [Scophthalmus maximus]|uniref:Uncharacterized protein n=1 Tax=Scophthalmus maximus TaxID=52904 RepID=A0A6A4S362_SCOMX|nr:hypothetical protein F2P81_018751 [Scophthalmus maximus]
MSEHFSLDAYARRFTEVHQTVWVTCPPVLSIVSEQHTARRVDETQPTAATCCCKRDTAAAVLTSERANARNIIEVSDTAALFSRSAVDTSPFTFSSHQFRIECFVSQGKPE